MLCLFELYALDIASVLSMSNDSLKLVKDHESQKPNNMSVDDGQTDEILTLSVR